MLSVLRNTMLKTAHVFDKTITKFADSAPVLFSRYPIGALCHRDDRRSLGEIVSNIKCFLECVIFCNSLDHIITFLDKASDLFYSYVFYTHETNGNRRPYRHLYTDTSVYLYLCIPIPR